MFEYASFQPRMQRYAHLYFAFLRNSLLRDMSFRANFIIECISSMSWVVMTLGFYLLIFQYAEQVGGWAKWDFFAFLATSLIINSIVEMFFMPNAENFSELIRKGGLDFLLLKPADTQFLVSLQRVDWSSLANVMLGVALLLVSMYNLVTDPVNPKVIAPQMFVLYPFYILCGVAILYSLMIALSATSIFLGRNQSLYDFWFYVTTFSRYPFEIYTGNALGRGLWFFFLFVIPVLVVVNVPARVVARPLGQWWLAPWAVLATALSLIISRWFFQLALRRYRSASS
jgi:ABC-2 type transport system permease protein